MDPKQPTQPDQQPQATPVEGLVPDQQAPVVDLATAPNTATVSPAAASTGPTKDVLDQAIEDLAAHPAKKGRKKLIIILVSIVTLLLLAGGTVAALWYIQSLSTGSSNNTNTSNNSSNTSEVPDYAQDLIDKVSADVADDLTADYPDLVLAQEEGGAAAYKVTGDNYYVTGPFGINLTVTSPSQSSTTASLAFSQAVVEVAQATLEQNSLSLQAPESEMFKEYQDDNTICTISVATYPAFVSCANKSSYADASATIKPYAEVYFDANPTADATTVFGAPKVTDSPTTGYQTASISMTAYDGVGGFAGLFYNVNGIWNYFTGTQSIIPCADYNTVPLKIAYESQTCYDVTTDSETTVKQ